MIKSSGNREGEADWTRGRVHVQRTWSEDGGRVERCKDSEDRWVKLPAPALEALHAHCEAMELEAGLKGWGPAERQLVFPNSVGHITSYGTFVEHVWQPHPPESSKCAGMPHGVEESGRWCASRLRDGCDHAACQRY